MSTNRNVANLSITVVKTLVKMAGFGPVADMIDGAQECLNLLADIKNDTLGNPNAEMIRSLNGAVKSELDVIQDALKHNGLCGKQVMQAAAQLAEAARETIKALAEDDDALIRAVQQPQCFAEQLRGHAAPIPDYSSDEMQAHYETLLDRIAEEFLTLAPWSPNFNRIALTSLLHCFPALSERIDRLEKQINEGFNSVREDAAAHHKDLKNDLASLHEDLRNKTTNNRPTKLEDEVWGSRPATLKHWIERDPTSNGTTLHDTIFSSPSSQRGSRCVLFGRAGSGKTSLAASIARRCESDKWSLVAWIDASTRSNIESGLIALGESVLCVQTNTPQDQRLRVEQVLATFRNTSKNKCLFVYDNVEGVDYLDGVLPDGPGVHVVVTTRRNSGWSNQEDWNIYALGNFTRDESVTHLLSATKDTDQTTAGKLASYLGDLPLAVAQAAATSSRYYPNLHDYYVSLQATNIEELLEPIEGGHYSKGAIASLHLAASSALSSIRDPQVLTEAQTILAALCYLAESGVPTQWFKSRNHLPSQKAYKVLQDSSIIDQSNDGKTTSIHRLQAHALRASHDSRIAHEGTLITSHFLDKINRTQHDEGVNTLSHPRQITYQLINQFSTLCSQSYSKTLFDYPQVQQCLFDTLRMAVSTSSILSSAAIRLAQAFSITEGTLGASHPKITRARSDLARAHVMASQYSAAASLHQVTTTHFLNTLGPAHPDTIKARNELACTYWWAGQYADAIAVHKETIADLTNALGPQHPDTIKALTLPVSTYSFSEPDADVTTFVKEIVANLTNILGPEHPDTIKARNELASTYWRAGQHADAIAVHKEIIAQLTSALGPQHPDTIKARYKLTWTYREAGQYADAIAVHKETIADLTNALGPQHPNTIKARNELARTYRQAGQHADAIAMHKEIIAQLTSALGPQHPDTIKARNELASTYRRAGQHADAIAVHKETIADLTNALGPQHRDTIKARNELASTYRRAGQYADAITLYEQLLTDSIRVLGEDHPLTTTVRENLEAARRELAEQEETSHTEEREEQD